MTLHGASIEGHTRTSWPASRVAATRSVPFLEHLGCGPVVSGSIGCIALTKVWLRTSWAVSSSTSSRGPTCLERIDKNDASLLGNAPKVFYHQRQETDHLSNLTVTMIKNNGTYKPKLRCSAAECRALVPFFGGVGGSDSVFAKDELRGSSVKIRPTLESVDPGCWGLKPKLHLWLELCASGASTSLFWT